nr:hypothetical protein [Actinomyces sp.]
MSPVLHAHLAGAPLALTGTGRPDTPPTLPPDLVQQVRTAPVGSTYVSTDGTGVGAWVWRRRPTGWVVVDGDTGWRSLQAGLDETVTGRWRTYRLRRAGDTLLVWADSLVAATITGVTSTSHLNLPLPALLTAGLASEGDGLCLVRYAQGTGATAGFLHAGITPSLLPDATWTAKGALIDLPVAPAGGHYANNGIKQLSASLAYRPGTPWPATLPGTPT